TVFGDADNSRPSLRVWFSFLGRLPLRSYTRTGDFHRPAGWEICVAAATERSSIQIHRGVSQVNQRRINCLATAIGLSLVAAGAQAAGRTDLQKQDVTQLKQQYQARVAARGVATMAHSRHAQFI